MGARDNLCRAQQVNCKEWKGAHEGERLSGKLALKPDISVLPGASKESPCTLEHALGTILVRKAACENEACKPARKVAVRMITLVSSPQHCRIHPQVACAWKEARHGPHCN